MKDKFCHEHYNANFGLRKKINKLSNLYNEQDYRKRIFLTESSPVCD